MQTLLKISTILGFISLGILVLFLIAIAVSSYTHPDEVRKTAPSPRARTLCAADRPQPLPYA